jgi:hypothetical protein
MSRVVDQLLKLIATFIGLSHLSRFGIICCINVFTSLLELAIVSHLSPRGSGRFNNHAHKSQLELETQHTEFATQMELKLLTQRIKNVESESGSLRMFRESLVSSSMRLGVPFIAPRQLGAVGGQTCLLSGGAPPDSHCSCPVHDLLPNQEHPTVGPRVGWRTGQSGVPNRPLLRATRRPRIAQPTVGAGDRWLIG